MPQFITLSIKIVCDDKPRYNVKSSSHPWSLLINVTELPLNFPQNMQYVSETIYIRNNVVWATKIHRIWPLKPHSKGHTFSGDTLLALVARPTISASNNSIQFTQYLLFIINTHWRQKLLTLERCFGVLRQQYVDWCAGSSQKHPLMTTILCKTKIMSPEKGKNVGTKC